MERKLDNGNSGILNSTIVLSKVEWPEVDDNLFVDENDLEEDQRNEDDATQNVNLSEDLSISVLDKTFDKENEATAVDVGENPKISTLKPSIAPKPAIQRGILSKFSLKASATSINMKSSSGEQKSVGAIKVKDVSSSTRKFLSNVKPVMGNNNLTKSLKLPLNRSDIKSNNNTSMPNKNLRLTSDVQKINSKPPFKQFRNLSQTSPNLQNMMKNSFSANKPLRSKASDIGTLGRRKSTDGILDTDRSFKSSRGKPGDSTSSASSRRTANGLSNNINTSREDLLSRRKSLSSKRDVPVVKRKTAVSGDKSVATKLLSASKSRSSLSSVVSSIRQGSIVISPNDLVKSKSNLSESKGLDSTTSKSKAEPNKLATVRRSSSSAATSQSKAKEGILVSKSRPSLSSQRSFHQSFKSCEKAEINDERSRSITLTEFRNSRKIKEANMKAFDVLAICFSHSAKENDSLTTLLEEKDKYISILQKNIETLEDQKTVAEKDFNNLLHQLGTDIETMCVKHEREKIALSEVQNSKIETLMIENHKKVEALKQKHFKDVEKLNDDHAKQLIDVNNANEKNIEQLKQNHAESLKSLQGEFDLEKNTLLNRNEILDSKLGTLIQSQSSGIDVKSSLIQELENDVRSLRSVLELRNEEIKTLKRENDEMSTSVASLNKSQTKIKNLSYQVEDLKELLEVKRRNERRLDSEMLKLEESIRSQSREKNQLYRDKEQLQWKMKHKLTSSFVNENHSQSFSGSTEHSEGNFKTFTMVHSSMNSTAPVQDNPLLTGFSKMFYIFIYK